MSPRSQTVNGHDIAKLKKDKQHNGYKKKDKGKNNMEMSVTISM